MAYVPYKTPNVFSTQRTLNAGSTAGVQLDFGFLASYLRLYNPSSVDLFFDLTESVASTCGTSHIVRACSEWGATVPRVQAVALHTTSTGATGPRISVLAMGE